MHIVLLDRIRNLGKIGDVVAVRRGYARNYLLPQGKALRASQENIKELESRREELERKDTLLLKEALKQTETMNDIALIFVRQASESGQLYGSVNVRDIKDAIEKEGYDILSDQILMNDRIKEVGLHPCSIALHADVIVPIILNVARNEAEAQTQWDERMQAKDIKIIEKEEKDEEKEEKKDEKKEEEKDEIKEEEKDEIKEEEKDEIKEEEKEEIKEKIKEEEKEKKKEEVNKGEEVQS